MQPLACAAVLCRLLLAGSSAACCIRPCPPVLLTQLIGLTASPASRDTTVATYMALHRLRDNLEAEYLVLDRRDEELMVGGVGCGVRRAACALQPHTAGSPCLRQLTR